MEYMLFIHQYPKQKGCDHKIDLKSINEDDAIKESITLLESGQFMPYALDQDYNDKVIGEIYNKTKEVHVKEITMKFEEPVVKEMIIKNFQPDSCTYV